MFSITNGTYRGCNASFEWLIQMKGHAIYYAPHVKQKKLIGTLQEKIIFDSEVACRDVYNEISASTSTEVE